MKPDLSACGTREFLRESVEESLKCLGVEYIDLLYQHRWVGWASETEKALKGFLPRVDPNTPIEITVRALAELVK